MSSRLAAALFLASIASAVELRSLPEFFRPDPFGSVVASDRAGSAMLDAVRMKSARSAYASAHLVVLLKGPGTYEINIESPFPAEVYREWFHLNVSDKKYYPDALIPVKLPFNSRMPDPENRVNGQTAQAFWLDVWIPEETKPGPYRGSASVKSEGQTSSIPIEINVLSKDVPQDDVVTMDSNSYGTGWMFDQYKHTLPGNDEDALFRLIHAYHKIFYEHRSTFHQLGYGHAGKVGPEFAPELAGTGASKHVSDWARFDRHYGPLLDGSAFRDTHRGARPIPFVYLPVNPEWPASFLWWGEPGYEREFVNVLSEMERHFRQKNWTSTRFEVFFNHKKRYKGFEWDGDEIRFSRDNEYLKTFRRMLDKAIPADSSVKFVMRADTSWTMAEQFSALRGVINFWVAGEGILSWYPDAPAQLEKRGDIVWTYGGTPVVNHAAASIAENPVKSWMSGVNGFVRWQTVAPGPDPWYSLTGGGETLVYPGDRFGIAGPLPSIRLKLQRNCVQDLDLLESRARTGNREQVQAEVARRFNGRPLSEWRNAPPPLASTPVLDWNNVNIGEALRPFESRFSRPAPGAWLRVREYALSEDSR